MDNKPHLVLGIDPGLYGALSLINPATREIAAIFDMPVFVSGVWKRNKVNVKRLSEIVLDNKNRILYAALEKVHAMPNQGVSSTFNFGETYGIIQGVLGAHGIEIVDVEPAVWKARFNLSRNKKESLVKAREFFPNQKNLFTLQKHEGRAEACLIALFGSQMFF